MTIRDIFTRRAIELDHHDEQSLEDYWGDLQNKRSSRRLPSPPEQDIAVTFDPRSSTNG